MGGGHHRNPEAEPRFDQDIEAMKVNKVPVAFRDTCAHILIPLNKCRVETHWSPFSCGHLRHTYEECQYYAWQDRVKAKQELQKQQQQDD